MPVYLAQQHSTIGCLIYSQLENFNPCAVPMPEYMTRKAKIRHKIQHSPLSVGVGAAPSPLQLNLGHAVLVTMAARVRLVLGHDLLQHVGRLGRVLALGADLFAVAVEEEGKGDTGDSQEGGYRAGPVDAEVLVHVGRKERESSAKEGTEDRVGGQD